MIETVRQVLVSLGEQSLSSITLLTLCVSAYGFVMLSLGVWIYHLVPSMAITPILCLFGSQAVSMFTYLAKDKTLAIWAFCTRLGIVLAVVSTVVLTILSFIFLVQKYKKKPELYKKFLEKQPKWKRPIYFILFVLHDGEFPVIRGRRGKWSASWD